PAACGDVLEQVLQRSGGNPFFIEELAHDLRERGGVAAGASSLPTTIEAVLQARLDRLSPLEREIVQAAAAVGHEFWRDAVRTALASAPELVLSERELDAALAALEQREIVFALPPSGIDDDRYAFKHAL